MALAQIVHFTSGCSRSAACARSYSTRLVARNAMRTETNLPVEECLQLICSLTTSIPAASQFAWQHLFQVGVGQAHRGKLEGAGKLEAV